MWAVPKKINYRKSERKTCRKTYNDNILSLDDTTKRTCTARALRSYCNGNILHQHLNSIVVERRKKTFYTGFSIKLIVNDIEKFMQDFSFVLPFP